MLSLLSQLLTDGEILCGQARLAGSKSPHQSEEKMESHYQPFAERAMRYISGEMNVDVSPKLATQKGRVGATTQYGVVAGSTGADIVSGMEKETPS